MTTETTTTSRNEVVQTSYKVEPCYGAITEKYDLLEIERLIVKENTKDRRLRPEEPLWLHPTGLPEQSTLKLRVQTRRKDTSASYWRRCPPDYAKKYGTSITWHRELPTDVIKSGYKYLPTNWELEARLAVKDDLVNLGDHLAEYQETAHMFLNAGRGLYRAYKNLRRGKKAFGRRRPELKDVSAAHIMTDYGVMPLVSDLYDSYEALRYRLGIPIWRRFSVYSVKQRTGVVDDDLHWSQQTSDRCTFYVQVDPRTYGSFTMGNPLEVAWEAVPGSFILDQLIPVGDYLSSLDALVGIKDLKGTVSSKTRYSHSYRGHLTWESAYDYMVCDSPGLMDFKCHKRYVINTIPQASLPEYQPSKSFGFVLNGLSLLHLMRHR
jgi:hypothetical protein